MYRKKLIFKEKFAKDILLRRKITTIRLSTNVRRGDVVDVIAGNLRIGMAVIEDIKIMRLKDITDEDALRDGYPNRDELIKDLYKIYGRRIADDTEVKVINFRLLR